VEHEAEHDQARAIFKTLDQDGDGVVTRDEVVVLLMSWGIPYVEAFKCFTIYDEHKTKAITFEQFYEDWAPIWQFQIQRVDEAKTKFRGFSTSLGKRVTSRMRNAKTPAP
jgi:Ca2+-binding EF-hand superfamily protein